MNKRERKKQINKRFRNINYSKIQYTNAIPNKETVKAINEPFYRIR